MEGLPTGQGADGHLAVGAGPAGVRPCAGRVRARLLTHKAAVRYDNGQSVTKESALAKLDASEAAREVAEDAVQTLGGYGYTTDFAPQRFYRDAKLMEIGEGTSEIQRLVLGRQLGL